MPQTKAAQQPWPPNPKAGRLRRGIGEFVLSSAVQNTVLVVILVNALTLGLQTSPRITGQFGWLLSLLDEIALAIFIIEVVLKLFALGPRFFKDGWNIFDFLVVGISLVPGASQFSVLRALRVLRVLRLINRLPQLKRIANAIVKAIPGIGAIAGLMVVIFYVGAVMATTLFGQSFPDWFGSVPRSLYSLFQIMTLESWSMGIVRPVMEVYPSAWAFFVPFILVSAFVMLNLFVAVIVDTMSNLSEDSAAAKPAADVEHEVPEHTIPAHDAAAHAQLELVTRELGEVRQQLAELTQLLKER